MSPSAIAEVKETHPQVTGPTLRSTPRPPSSGVEGLNSGTKILTTSVFRFQEFAIDSLEDGLLFLTEGNHAGDLETVLSVS